MKYSIEAPIKSRKSMSIMLVQFIIILLMILLNISIGYELGYSKANEDQEIKEATYQRLILGEIPTTIDK